MIPSVWGLTAQQVPSAAPEQRVAKASEAHKRQEQPQTQRNDQTTPKAFSSTPQPAPPRAYEAAQERRQEFEVQSWLMYFTGALVLVGLLQVGSMIWQAILLRHTRGDVRRQADTMEQQAADARTSAASASATAQQTLNAIKRQNKTLHQQATWQKFSAKAAMLNAKAALESARAAAKQIQAMKDRERGRLRIEFDKVNLSHGPDEYEYALPFKVILDGMTQVFIGRQSCFAGISEGGEGTTEPNSWRTMAVPKTITPEDRTFSGKMLLLTSEIPWGEPYTAADEQRVSLVREEKLYIFVRALIAYDDLFGGKWEARFNAKWRYFWDPYINGPDLTNGHWESIGDNGEYRMEQHPQNPN